MVKATLAVGFLCLAFSISVQSQSSSKPNIIFLILDDLNTFAEYLDGHPQANTPNLNRLAQKGVVFTNAYCNATASRMSRTSFMSGKNPLYTQVYHGVEDYDYTPVFREHFTAALGNETVFTIPELLKDSGGYYTFGINKTYFGVYPSSEKDFDAANPDPCSRQKSWSNLVDWRSYCPDGVGCEEHGISKRSWGFVSDAESTQTRDHRTVDTLISFLNRYSVSPAQYCNRPFFIAAGLVRPHVDWYTPEAFYSEFYRKEAIPDPFEILYNNPPNLFPPNGAVLAPQPAIPYSDTTDLAAISKQFYSKGLDLSFRTYADTISSLPFISADLTDAERREIVEQNLRANAFMAYMACIQYMDFQIGRVLDRIEADPVLSGNTVLVVASDHGYMMGEKTLYSKGNIWEKILRVPFIIVDPRKPGNKVCKTPVSLVDLMPTFNEIAGVADPVFPDGTRYPDGESLVPLINNPSETWNRFVNTSYRFTTGAEGSCFPIESVRGSRFHYNRYKTNGASGGCDETNSEIQEELYELGENRDVDPHEWNNLAANPRYQGVINYMSQFLPEGSRYLQKSFGAEIEVLQSSCSLGDLDTLIVKANYENEIGEVVLIPSNITASWKVAGTGIIASGPELILPLADIDPDSLAQLGRLLVELTLSDTSGAFALDLGYFYLKANQPETTFDLQWDGSGIEVINFVRTGPPARTTKWIYSDGYVSLDSIPASHRVTGPGTYGVRYRFEYGPENDVCGNIVQRYITLTDSHFQSGPCNAPNPPVIPVAEFDRAVLEWNPVFGATSYNIRVRPAWPAFASWIETTGLTDTSHFFTSLKPGGQFEVEIQALCDLSLVSTDVSDWSYRKKFTTTACPPPAGLSAEAVTATSSVIQWSPINEEVVDVRVRKFVGGVPWVNYPGITADSLWLSGLDPGSLYRVQARSRCLFSTGKKFTGKQLTETQFVMPVLKPAADVSQIMMKVYPNPAGDFVTAQFEGEGRVELIDIMGQIVREVSGTGNVTFDLKNHTDGLYFVKLNASGNTGSDSFLHVSH